MAVHYITPKRGHGTREDLPLVSKEADDIVLVDEGDVDGQELKDRRQLLHRKRTRRELQCSPGRRISHARRFLIEPCLCLRPRGKVDVEGRSHRHEIVVGTVPLHLREVPQTEREQDALLLKGHLAHALHEIANARLVQRQGLCIRLECLDDHAELALHLIVNAPHHLRRPRDAVVIEHRHQQLFLLDVVHPQIAEGKHVRQHDIHALRAVQLSRNRIEQLFKGVILRAQNRQRVSLG